jgi:hypothetical protein
MHCKFPIAPEDILHSSSNIEILLFKSEFFTSLHFIIRIENRSYIFGFLGFLNRVIVLRIPCIHRFLIVIIRSGSPQPQIIGVESIVASHRHIIGSGNHQFATFPFGFFHLGFLSMIFHFDFSHVPVHTDLIDHVRSFNFPRIALFQPIVRHLNLFKVD